MLLRGELLSESWKTSLWNQPKKGASPLFPEVEETKVLRIARSLTPPGIAAYGSSPLHVVPSHAAACSHGCPEQKDEASLLVSQLASWCREQQKGQSYAHYCSKPLSLPFSGEALTCSFLSGYYSGMGPSACSSHS